MPLSNLRRPVIAKTYKASWKGFHSLFIKREISMEN